MFGRERIGVVAGNGVGLRKIPVDQRKINRKIDSAPFAGFCKFFHQISLVGRCIHNIELCELRMIQAKSVVVLGGKNNGAHSGFFGQRHNFVGIPFGWIKIFGRIGIPVAENSRKRLNLFAVTSRYRFSIIHTTVNGVKSEVDKHGKFLVEPLLRGLLCGSEKNSRKE